jgi:hypothetical protein
MHELFIILFTDRETNARTIALLYNTQFSNQYMKPNCSYISKLNSLYTISIRFPISEQFVKIFRIQFTTSQRKDYFRHKALGTNF